jgi:hypothetical protein
MVPRTSFEPHLSRSGEDSNSFESQSQRDGRQLENPPRQTYDATSAAPATQSGSSGAALDVARCHSYDRAYDLGIADHPGRRV